MCGADYIELSRCYEDSCFYIYTPLQLIVDYAAIVLVFHILPYFLSIRSPDKVNATMGKVNAPRYAEVH